MPKFRKGSLIDSYRLKKRLGGGASAVVYLAKVEGRKPVSSLEIDQKVALKIYNSDVLVGYQQLRIHREFSIASDLEHENIVRVYDLVISPSREQAFLAMEYIDGCNLKEYINTNGPLSREQTIRVANQLFSAIGEIHELGALHRDVKPANVLLAGKAISMNEPTVKLADLGIVFTEDGAQLTMKSDSLASKHYASYEQLMGGKLDARADIYSVGAVMFHCMTGREPYADVGPATAVSVLMSQDHNIWADATNMNNVCPKLKEFVDECLSRAPEQRPRSAAECLQRLFSLDADIAIGFEYLPESPESHGWKLVREREDATAEVVIEKLDDANVAGFKLQAQTYAEYCINEKVKTVEFKALFHNKKTSRFYLRVSLVKDNETQTKWISYCPGGERSEKTHKNEWALDDIYNPQYDQNGNVISHFNVGEVVNATWGRDGWKYKRLDGIRLRGGITISTIRINI